jgi:L-2-hydroxyglutarate oxidase LhgO
MTDVLVIGGGITGLAVARAVVLRRPGTRVTVVDKEPKLAAHASGRNSGVIHAGLYYRPGSLKAKLCVEGARRLKEFCSDRSVPIRSDGKLVVATSPADLPKLHALAENATANGARVELMDKAGLRQIAPACTAATAALWSPDTATVDPKALLDAVARDAEARGVEIVLGEALQSVDLATGAARTSRGTRSFGLLVNAAGSHADRIAALCGERLPYRLVPFLGRYFQLASPWEEKIGTHIYPLPPDGLPFLGVHVTRSMGGSIYLGPTATPALGREHYGGLTGLAPLEALPAVRMIAAQLLRNVSGMRALIWREAQLLWRTRFLAEARRLVPALRPSDLIPCSKAGIRAQLVDVRSYELVHDFVIHKGPRAVHVLNAVSPGLTSALAFADVILDRAEAAS